MRYYLDTEFNGFGGKLISMGLIREDGRCHYAINNALPISISPWVCSHVIPILDKTPPIKAPVERVLDRFGDFIGRVLLDDEDPIIITDWPDDITYFSKELITSPGCMIPISQIKFEMYRVDAWPNDIPGGYQHHALWDAIALRYYLTGKKNFY